MNPAQAELINLERSWASAELHHDARALSRLMSDDLVLTETDGVYNKSDQVAFTADPENHFEAIESYDLKVQVHGDAAVVTGGLHEKGTSHGKTFEHRGRFTDTWVRHNGRWQCVASHFSTMARE